MVTQRYVPDRGGLVWISLNPQAGHEQAGRRPALVLSPAAYNRATGLAIICPITGQAKNYPFEVVLPASCGISGVILSDHVKSVDWVTRQADHAGRAPDSAIDEVVGLIATLIG